MAIPAKQRLLSRSAAGRAPARQDRDTPSIYPLIVTILNQSAVPLSTREIFNRLTDYRVKGIKTHDVSKALNNLKARGDAASSHDPSLGRVAHRWFAPNRSARAAKRHDRKPVFHFTPSGALSIVTDHLAVVIPAKVMPHLLAFLAESSRPQGRIR